MVDIHMYIYILEYPTVIHPSSASPFEDFQEFYSMMRPQKHSHGLKLACFQPLFLARWIELWEIMGASGWVCLCVCADWRYKKMRIQDK